MPGGGIRHPLHWSLQYGTDTHDASPGRGLVLPGCGPRVRIDYIGEVVTVDAAHGQPASLGSHSQPRIGEAAELGAPLGPALQGRQQNLLVRTAHGVQHQDARQILHHFPGRGESRRQHPQQGVTQFVDRQRVDPRLGPTGLQILEDLAAERALGVVLEQGMDQDIGVEPAQLAFRSAGRNG